MTKELHTYTFKLAAPESEFSPEFVQMMANRMAVKLDGSVDQEPNAVR